jgi:hypothetical protein
MEANRSLSEGGTGRGDAMARAGSSNVTLAAEPTAAAPAPTFMKSRRVIESLDIEHLPSWSNPKKESTQLR